MSGKFFTDPERGVGLTSMPARMQFLTGVVLLCFAVLVLRMFYVQVFRHGDFVDQAENQHALIEELQPKRGTIFMQDYETDSLVPVALSQDLGFVFAVPKEIENTQETVDALVEILDLKFDEQDEEEKIIESEASQEISAGAEEVHIVGTELDSYVDLSDKLEEEKKYEGPTEYERFVTKLSSRTDPYEPIKRDVPEEQLSKLRERAMTGIYYTREPSRLYPEEGIGGHVLGFVGRDDDGKPVGRYGIEGYFDEELAGVTGQLLTQKDAAGRLVSVGERTYMEPKDGADIILTIDRTVQFMACKLLRQSILKNEADGGSVVIMDPKTGGILAMCGYPDFYPGSYGDTESIDVFNNPATFAAYEPGSIFKPITMAAALDTETVTPSSTFEDSGEVKVGVHTIHNYNFKAYGKVTMTEILENSINTGMVHVVGETGYEIFRDYVSRFGFGEKVGLTLEKESTGDVSNLEKEGDIFALTASFGQGISVTPIQMAQAYGAIANSGIMMKPRVVEEVRFADGYVERMDAEQISRVMSAKSARLLGAMLVSVVENGHATKAGVDGYYIAGKTGTAQVAREGKYVEGETIGSFVGFGPVEDPRFVMITRIDNPVDERDAVITAAPLFGEIAGFLLEYLNVAPSR